MTWEEFFSPFQLFELLNNLDSHFPNWPQNTTLIGQDPEIIRDLSGRINTQDSAAISSLMKLVQGTDIHLPLVRSEAW